MDTNNIITVGSVVDNVLNDLGTYDESEYIRLYQLALRGVTQMNMFHTSGSKEVKLSVDSKGTVTLPSDYLSYIKISVVINGRKHELSKNEDIMIPGTGACYAEEDNGNQNYTETLPEDTVYGMGGGYNYSYYRIDKKYNRIIFQKSVPNGEIILDYISSGVALDGETYIPKQSEEALIAWTHWKREEHDPNVSQYKKQSNERSYNRELRKLHEFEYDFTLQEFADAISSGYSQTAKR